MTTDISVEPLGPTVRRKGGRPRREVIYRHAVILRLCHWINALSIFLMIGSGLNIFNAHPRLYWGQAGGWYDKPFLAIGTMSGPHGMSGVLRVGAFHFDTTGWLGWFPAQNLARGWPTWITIPSFQDLADARHWHFFFAWILVANGFVYLTWALLSRHIWRDLRPTFADLKTIPRSVWDHVRLKHPTGEEAKRYNVLQKLAYLGLICLVIGMVLTGLTLSPGMDAFAPGLLILFGGRQSARTLHFIFANLIVLFILVHLTEVVLAGPWNEVRSMVTGRYVVPQPHKHTAHDHAPGHAEGEV